MAAAKGNKYAEKWTEATILKTLEKIRGMSDKGIYCHTAALAELGLYDSIWTYWTERFKNNPQVLEAIKNIDAKFKGKIIQDMLLSKISTPGAIFVLKNMGMSDRTDLNLSGSSKIVFEVVRSGNGKKN